MSNQSVWRPHLSVECAEIVTIQTAKSRRLHGRKLTQTQWLEMAIANQKMLDDQMEAAEREQAPNLVAA